MKQLEFEFMKEYESDSTFKSDLFNFSIFTSSLPLGYSIYRGLEIDQKIYSIVDKAYELYFAGFIP